MEKLSGEKARIFNETFVDQVESGNTKEAAASLQGFTRMKLREESFTEKILTPIDVTNSDLARGENPELHVIWNDREPDIAPAVTVPLGTLSRSFEFRGTRYPTYFARYMSPVLIKDVSKLRNYDYDIRALMLELSTKDIATAIDTKFIETVDSVIGTVNTSNVANSGLALPQNVTIPGGLTRDNLSEAFKVIQRLKVPFGPTQPDGGESKGCMLMNNQTAQDILKLSRAEIGGDLAQEMFVSGKPIPTLFGVKAVYTIKDDLIPDGVVYFFSAEEFFGKMHRLEPLTVFLESKAFFLSMFQYMQLGITIGNVRGVTRCQF